jgi:hypothetical protein
VNKLSGFGAIKKEDWLPGIYFMADHLHAAVIVVHQLPSIPETLWLRILGRGGVQKRAVDELEDLPADHPFRQVTLDLLYTLQKNLVINQELEKEDRELIMRLAPLYQQEKAQLIQESIQQGVQQGIQQGVQQGEQQLIVRQLHRRVGQLDSELTEQIYNLSLDRLESLGEALLDFSSVTDLLSWLNQQVSVED